jgi:uncharacterized protein with GYD domain
MTGFRWSMALEGMSEGGTMPKYLATFTYSAGSWARMIDRPEDRTTAAQNVVEAVGGRLECIYWQMDNEDGLVIAEFPDSVAASAVQAAIVKTGAFKSVEMHELLTKQQLRDRLVLARDATQAFEVPGQSH